MSSRSGSPVDDVLDTARVELLVIGGCDGGSCCDWSSVDGDSTEGGHESCPPSGHSSLLSGQGWTGGQARL